MDPEKLEERFNFKETVKYFGHYTRFVIMAVSILALVFVVANSLALNFTVICMFKHVPDEIRSKGNFTEPELLYSVDDRSWLFSAIAIGNIIGTIPLTWCTNTLGVRITFTAYGLVSGISTLLLPLFSNWGFFWVFLIRIFQGFAVALSFTSLGAIVSNWSTLSGSGTYISILSAHIQLSAILIMPTSGALCASPLGWPMVYYIFGVLTIAAFGLFYLFYRDSPAKHKNVSQNEARKITKGKLTVSDNDRANIPYRAILADPCFWGVAAICIGGCLGFQILFQYGPIYLNEILGFDVRSTGFAAALPYILGAAVKFVAGPVSNMFTCLSERGKSIMFATASQLPVCVCFVMMATLPADMLWLIQIAFTLVNCFVGLAAVGIAKSVQLIAQHHAHFIMTIMGFCNSLVVFVLPFFVKFVAPDNSPQQWSTIFYIISAVTLAALTIFNVTCKAEPRPWAYSTNKVVDVQTVSYQADEERGIDV